MLLTASEIISRTWKTFTTHWVAIAKFMVALGLSSVALELTRSLEIFVWYSGIPILPLLVKITIAIAISFITFWFHLALVKSLGEAYQNSQVESFWSALKSTKTCYWSSYGAAILYGLMVGFGTLLLIVPGVIFMVWYLLFQYAIIFEKKTMIGGLERSKELVVGRWWSVLWRALVPVLIFAVILTFIQMILEAPLAPFAKTWTAWTIDLILTALSEAIFLSLSTLSILILFFNLRETPLSPSTTALEK